MNESEFQRPLCTSAPRLRHASSPRPRCCSSAGEAGLQADAEDAETARVPLACGGRRAPGGLPVVGGAVEPSEDAGRHEEPSQQERPGPLVHVPG